MLSYTPDVKYAEDGEPSAPDSPDLPTRTTDPVHPTESFAAMPLLDYLMGAPDAHAKNYSLIRDSARKFRIAPLYDVASGLPYDLSWSRPLRLAMSIGGENRLGRVGRNHIERFSDTTGIGRERCVNLMANLYDRVPTKTRDCIERSPPAAAAGSRRVGQTDRSAPRCPLRAHAPTALAICLK